MREDSEKIHEVMLEVSTKIEKCAYDMTIKGSCPEKNECTYPHATGPRQKSEKKSIRYCFKELLKSGLCNRGKTCKFSHKISQEQRNDPNFLEERRKEKEETAAKCINEFKGEGLCNRRSQCHFSHQISAQERNDENLKRKMEEREKIVKSKARGDSNGRQNYMKQVEQLREEVKELTKVLNAAKSDT